MSLVINAILIGPATGRGMPEFTYMVDNIDRANDPAYVQLLDDGNGNWRIHFLESGTLTFTKLGSAALCDLFLVGGGGGGGASGSGGGGGGYTATFTSLTPVLNRAYPIEIGEGGTAGLDGTTTSAFGHSAEGGKAGEGLVGGDGGSGGGSFSYGYASLNAANGGSDGSDGFNGTGQFTAGEGQGTTTREFGEDDGELYAGGGAGGSGYNDEYKQSQGGLGGGGASGYGGNPNTGGMTTAGSNGTPNTGGGGGAKNGTGGSGIASLRNHRQ